MAQTTITPKKVTKSLGESCRHPLLHLQQNARKRKANNNSQLLLLFGAKKNRPPFSSGRQVKSGQPAL